MILTPKSKNYPKLCRTKRVPHIVRIYKFVKTIQNTYLYMYLDADSDLGFTPEGSEVMFGSEAED